MPEKEEFLSKLDMEDITDSYYNYAKRVSNKFGDFYLKSNTLLLADVFENSRNMYLEIYQLDHAKFLSAWQAALKSNKVELFTDTDKILMVKKELVKEHIP